MASAFVEPDKLFSKCWAKVEALYGDELIAPREIIWLNGPPGAGKGANSDFIKRIRGMSRSITCSDLLEKHPPAKRLMESGSLVSDEIVGDALLQAIFNPDENDGSGLIVDGFPRTPMQVELIKQMYDKLRSLYKQHLNNPDKRGQYPRPSFKVVVLYVDEATSIERQMQRSKLAAMHNKKVQEAGAGKLKELRGTDCSIEKCKYRYQVFRTHYPALVKLQQVMPFSIIDASGSLEECESQIAHELRYQSSLDLDEATYAAVTSIPLAREVVQAARQKLVHRLDGYCHRDNETFRQVLALIQNHTLPVLRKCSLSGFAAFSTKDDVFNRNSLAVDMFIDILTDRGFSVSHLPTSRSIPRKIDLRTGDIHCETETTHGFRITFEKVGVRETAKRAEEASFKAFAAAERALMTTSVIPKHLDHGHLYHDRDGHTRGIWRVDGLTKIAPHRSSLSDPAHDWHIKTEPPAAAAAPADFPPVHGGTLIATPADQTEHAPAAPQFVTGTLHPIVDGPAPSAAASTTAAEGESDAGQGAAPPASHQDGDGPPKRVFTLDCLKRECGDCMAADAAECSRHDCERHDSDDGQSRGRSHG